MVNGGMQVVGDMPGTSICVSLDGSTVESITDGAVRANLAGADLVEIRFDKLYLIEPDMSATDEEEGDLPQIPAEEEWDRRVFEDVDFDETFSSLKNSLPLPVLFTVRPTSEGGFFPGNEKQRLGLLEKAISSGVEWIDLEISIKDSERTKLLELAQENQVKVIASQHDLVGMPTHDEIIKIVTENQDKGDVVKFCGNSQNHQDALEIINAIWELKGGDLAYSLMAINKGGDWGRLHGPLFEQDIVFATMKNEFRLSDKGLVNIRDLKEAWTLLEY